MGADAAPRAFCGHCGQLLREKRRWQKLGRGYHERTGERSTSKRILLVCPDRRHWWQWWHAALKLQWLGGAWIRRPYPDD